MERILPIYWGNQVWVQREDGYLEPRGPIDSSDKNWIDYSNLSKSGESADFLKNSHPQSSYRQQFHKQILKKFLAEIPTFQSKHPACILTHGGIASGKSSAIELLLNHTETTRRYFHIDFDIMKRFLPEFSYMMAAKIPEAASFTQSESAKLAGNAFKKTIKKSVSVIYEGSLSSLETISERIEAMRRKRYEISCISTYISVSKGVERAKKRFDAGGRFVPESVIRKTYQNCPGTLVALMKLVDVLVLINNEADETPSRVVLRLNSGLVKECDKTLYESYLADVGVNRRLI